MSRHVTVASVSTKPNYCPDTEMDQLLDEAAHYAWRADAVRAAAVAEETGPRTSRPAHNNG